MAQRTEHVDEAYRGLDSWSSERILSAIVDAQVDAVASVGDEIAAIARAGDAVAERLRAGGRFAYAGAGSSGLLAQVDALELPGTYGIEADRVPVLLAGGRDALVEIPSGAEDDEAEAEEAVDRVGLGDADALLAISASGSTPYAIAAVRRAARRGAITIGMACNGGTPLLRESDFPILLRTPPEVVAGSTRMNAGTAQKCALNMLSTLIGIRLGHTYDGMMVNVRADNAKLRKRALQIVARASGKSLREAETALRSAGGDVKAAILISAGSGDRQDALELIERSGGNVRAALAELDARHRKAG